MTRLLAGLLTLIVACYGVALSGPFQFDDYATVAVDPGAMSLSAWWDGITAHVRPLTKGSFALTHLLGQALGNVPLGHRLGNLFLHLVTVVLFWRLGVVWARRSVLHLPERDIALATGIAAAVFGLHPLATEAVSYISGRSMSLGTLLALASLLAWITARSRASLVAYGIAMLLVCLAAMARETTAATIPLLVFLWELGNRDANALPFGWKRTLAAAQPALIAGALSAAVLAWMLTHDRYAALLQMSVWIAQARSGDASLLASLSYFFGAAMLWHYPDIDPAVNTSLGWVPRLACSLMLVAVLWCAWQHRARHPHWLFGALWVLAWLLPLYALPIRHDAVSERHFYPALWGLALPLGITLATLMRGPGHRVWFARTLGAAALILLVATTVLRNGDYRSEVALWEASRRNSPDKPRVLNNLGVAYMTAGRWDDANAVLLRALAREPGDATVLWNLRAARARDLQVLSQPAFID